MGMSTRAFNFRERVEGLDGNGQLFLALQDMNMDNAFGSGKATAESVASKNAENYETYPVIVRPNRNADQNEDFIKKNLCAGRSSNYKKVYTDKFDVEIKKAIGSIISDLKNMR